jgi:hypothetical protein
LLDARTTDISLTYGVTVHDIQTTLLAILKYSGLLVSLVSGMVATAFETKEDDGKGSRRLSLFGKVVFGCVVLGSMISIVSQLLEDHQKRLDEIAAKQARDEDVKRISYIIDGTQRIAYHIQPIVWNVSVRYTVGPASPLWQYVNRIETVHPGLSGYDLVDDYVPNRADKQEQQAWSRLIQPSIYIGILKPELWSGPARKMAVPILSGVSVSFAAMEHADKEFLWKAGPDAVLPPFYSRMQIRKQDATFLLTQDFVVRDSPDATQVSGIISPLDIANYIVVAEGPTDAFVSDVNVTFPSANRGIDIRMTETNPIMGFNRSFGTLKKADIRGALNIAPVPGEK